MRYYGILGGIGSRGRIELELDTTKWAIRFAIGTNSVNLFYFCVQIGCVVLAANYFKERWHLNE